MSTITISMPAISESSLKAAFKEYATTSLLPALAKKYGFDVEEEARALNLDDLKVNKTTSKGGKAKKTEGEEKPKVKRGPTGYLLFTADARPSVKLEMEAEIEEGVKLKPQLVVTELAKRWKALSDEETAEWNEKAKAAKTPPSSDGEEQAPAAAAAKKETKKETKKAKKDEGGSSDAAKKKKGTTGYLMFAKEVRPEVKAELEAELDDGVKLKPQDTVTEIANRWKALDDDERGEWNEKAKSPEPSDESE
jgi:gluconate kinase